MIVRFFVLCLILAGCGPRPATVPVEPDGDRMRRAHPDVDYLRRHDDRGRSNDPR